MPPRWFIYHFASGQALFSGVGLNLLAIALTTLFQSRPARMGRNVAAIIGGILVALSAVPLPFWLLGIFFVAVAGWLIVEGLSQRVPRPHHTAARTFVALVCVVMLGLEIPWQLRPAIAVNGRPRLVVLGDSITAGMGGAQIVNWPNLLAKDHGLSVTDLSEAGAKLKQGERQAERIPDEPCLVLIELGGNDMLGGGTAAEFAADLDKLFTVVCRSERTVAMLELPLLPFGNAFGSAQRDAASRHHVTLIPKRYFAAIIAGEDATVDSLHLSQRGQNQMAEMIWSFLAKQYESR